MTFYQVKRLPNIDWVDVSNMGNIYHVEFVYKPNWEYLPEKFQKTRIRKSIKTFKNKEGHLWFRDPEGFKRLVSWAVLCAFGSPKHIDKGYKIEHINGNKEDNRFENLRWMIKK